MTVEAIIGCDFADDISERARFLIKRALSEVCHIRSVTRAAPCSLWSPQTARASVMITDMTLTPELTETEAPGVQQAPNFGLREKARCVGWEAPGRAKSPPSPGSAKDLAGREVSGAKRGPSSS